MSQELSNRSEISRARIAIIDDDLAVRTAVYELLQANGFDSTAFSGGPDFFDCAHQLFDLALVDLRLNAESGLVLAMAIKEQFGSSIIMLTGVGDETDKIVGLETGADDYITKPFNPRELVARIRAVLRRNGRKEVQQAKPSSEENVLGFGDLMLETLDRKLKSTSGDEIPLTNAEYRLLEYFLKHPNEIITRTALLEEMGSDLSQYVDRTVDVIILRLRRKIEKVPSKPQHLQTRRGLGYIFVTDEMSDH